jgi:hypothetical protein
LINDSSTQDKQKHRLSIKNTEKKREKIIRTNAIAIKHVDCASRKKKPNGTDKSKWKGK